MHKQQLEKWVWILIYGGMLGFSLGWFVEPSSAAVGWALMIAGAAIAAAGAVGVFVRSRMGP